MKKIVLVEDDKQLAKMYKTKLETDGYEVIWLIDGAKIIETINQEKPDLVLLDMAIPNISGLDILKKMEKESLISKVPVVVITNSAFKYHCEEALKLGAKECLYKYHFTPAYLSKKVKEILG